MRAALTVVSLVILASRPASAQAGVPVPTMIAWERVALGGPFERFDVEGLGFCGDTLLATETTVRALRGGGPGHPASAGTWEEVSRAGGFDAECAEVAGRSILYVRRPSSLDRSLDGGYTTEPVLVSGQTIPVRTPGGALVGYFPFSDLWICRTDDGEAWTCHEYTPGDTGFPRFFAAARPGGPIPEARLLANGQGGPAYSDDDGRTWRPSNLMTDIQTFGDGLCVVDGGPLHGRALASAQNASGRFRIFESTDGAMWTDVGPAPDAVDPGRSFVYLTAAPGGLVAAYGSGTHVWLSGDGGRSWRDVFDADGPLNTNDKATDVEAGPDGRLYASVSSQQSQDAAERGGVYRTAEPVFVVSGEALPVEVPGGVGVSVRPNPAGGRVEVVVSLVEAGPVRVVVLDALGREVAVVLAGEAAAGEQTASVDASRWPAGVYVVRAAAGAGVATARLVVAR